MKIYQVEETTQDEILIDYKFVNEEDKKLFMKNNLGQPKRIRKEWPNVELTRVDGRIPGDFIFVNSGRGLFLNEKALTLLSKYFENCEMLDIYVDETRHYYINVLELVDCLDKENSDYDDDDFEEYEYLMIDKFALLKENLEDKNIFRVKLDSFWEGAEPQMDVFVSERFKQTVEEAGLNGFKFVEVPVR